MFSSSLRKTPEIRKTHLPLGVETNDVRRLKEIITASIIRKNNNHTEKDISRYVDETIERNATRLRILYPELETYNSEEIIIMSKKKDHFNAIRRNINTGITTIAGLNLFMSSKIFILSSILETIRGNNEEISKLLCKFFEADFSIEEEEEQQDDNKVLISSEKDRDIIDLLNRFNLPPNLSSDVGDIYKNGPSISTFFSLLTNIWSKYLAPSEEDTSAFNFDRV